MIEDILTVDQVAGILSLHPKTVRGFIRTGKLSAKKIGKEWRVRREDIDRFTGKNESNTQSIENNKAAGSGMDAASLIQREKMQATTILDIYVSDRNEADRLSVHILATTQAKGQEYGNARVDYIYYDTESKARFILIGTARFIGELLVLVSKIS
jgi:excisionase family DNA binding protein